MNIILSFPFDSFKDTSEAFLFIDEFASYYKKGILSSKSPDGFIEYDLKEITNYIESNRLDSFNLISNYSLYFEFINSITFRRSYLNQLNVFSFSLESISNIKLKELIESSAEKMFSTLFIYDALKSAWQNEIVISNYKTFNKKFDHLVRIWDDELSPALGELIDISQNPGHLKETYSMVLMAAPEMWFGPTSMIYFDKENFKKFPKANKISEITSNVLYIKLFDWSIQDYENQDILNLQQNFRKWTKMDEVENELNRKVIKNKEIMRKG